MATFSDTELKRRIALQKRRLEQVKPGSWTAQKIQETIDAYLRQLAKPRDQRTQWERGTL